MGKNTNQGLGGEWVSRTILQEESAGKRHWGGMARKGYKRGWKGHASIWGLMNMHLFVNVEWCTCAFISEFQSLPAKREEGILAVYTYVLCKSCMWVLLKAVPCLWQLVQLVVSVSFVRVCGRLSAIQAQLSYLFQLWRAKQQWHPSAWDGDPWSLYRRKPQHAELLEVVAMYNIP